MNSLANLEGQGGGASGNFDNYVKGTGTYSSTAFTVVFEGVKKGQIIFIDAAGGWERTSKGFPLPFINNLQGGSLLYEQAHGTGGGASSTVGVKEAIIQADSNRVEFVIQPIDGGITPSWYAPVAPTVS